jgi:hypothetical protein
MTLADGSRYDGQFEDGVRSGQGCSRAPRAVTKAAGRTMCHKAPGASTTSTVPTTRRMVLRAANGLAYTAAPTDRTTKATGWTTCRTGGVNSSSPTTTHMRRLEQGPTGWLWRDADRRHVRV